MTPDTRPHPLLDKEPAACGPYWIRYASGDASLFLKVGDWWIIPGASGFLTALWPDLLSENLTATSVERATPAASAGWQETAESLAFALVEELRRQGRDLTVAEAIKAHQWKPGEFPRDVRIPKDVPSALDTVAFMTARLRDPGSLSDPTSDISRLIRAHDILGKANRRLV